MTRRMEKTGLAALVVALVSCQLTEKAVEEVPTPSSDYLSCDLGELEAYVISEGIYENPVCTLTPDGEQWMLTDGQEHESYMCGSCTIDGDYLDYCCYNLNVESTVRYKLIDEINQSEITQYEDLCSQLAHTVNPYDLPGDRWFCIYYMNNNEMWEEQKSNLNRTCEYTEDINIWWTYNLYHEEIKDILCISNELDEFSTKNNNEVQPGGCCYLRNALTEQEGIEVFVDVLSSTGLAFEVQDGTWSIYAAETALVPDVRFLVGGQYAYLEFNSVEDPGVGIATNFPVYREVHPGHYAQVVSQTSLWIDQALQIMKKDVKE